MIIKWLYGSRCSRMNKVKIFKGCLTQILLGPFLNTLTHIIWTNHFRDRLQISLLLPVSFILLKQMIRFFWKIHNPLHTELKYSILFPLFSGLKSDLRKCEITEIGALNAVQWSACSMKYLDLCNEAIKILGTSYAI